MGIDYFPGEGPELPPYWWARDPSMEDIEEMIFELGARDFYNFVVVGVPCEISPQWLAKHTGYTAEEAYEYASSYSIYKDDLGDMLDSNDTPLEAFNYYLEGTGKCWREIEEIKLVDRRKPWKGTY